MTYLIAGVYSWGMGRKPEMGSNGERLNKKIDKVVATIGAILLLTALGWIIVDQEAQANGYTEPEAKIEVDTRECQDDGVDDYLRKVNDLWKDVSAIVALGKSDDVSSLIEAQDRTWRLAKKFNELEFPLVFEQFNKTSFVGYVDLAEALEAKAEGKLDEFDAHINTSVQRLARARDIFNQVMKICGYGDRGMVTARR